MQLQYKDFLLSRRLMDSSWTWGHRGTFCLHPESRTWKPIRGDSRVSRVDPQESGGWGKPKPRETLLWRGYGICSGGGSREWMKVQEAGYCLYLNTRQWMCEVWCRYFHMAKAIHSAKLLSVSWGRDSTQPVRRTQRVLPLLLLGDQPPSSFRVTLGTWDVFCRRQHILHMQKPSPRNVKKPAPCHKTS